MTPSAADSLAIVASESPFQNEAEAARELANIAHRKTGSVPVDTVVAHVLAVTEGGDWPVRRAAMEAILRRRQNAEREPLKIAAKPSGRKTYGLYQVRAGTGDRTYTTLLRSTQPIALSCDCADFLRSSLGLCKHGWTVLEKSIQRTPVGHVVAVAPPMLLTWDSIRPLTGKGDPLERIRWNPSSGSPPLISKLLERRFVEAGESRALRSTHTDSSEQRLALVEELASVAKSPDSTEPALRQLLTIEAARLSRLVENRDIADDSANLAKGVKRRLFAYQLEGVKRAVGRGRLLLGDDMGLGKTAQAIATCHVLWTKKRVRRGLVIVPAALKPQWEREWRGFTDVPIAIVDGSADERAAIYERTASGFLIANYEQIHRDLALMEKWEPGIVVLDEAQRIKNWQTKTAASVKRLHPSYRLVLTGTPMENRLDELASVIEWVDDMALEPKWRLAPWHAIATDGRREARGARNLSTLRDRLSDSFLRRRRQEVLDQLPERGDTRVPVEMTPTQLEEHDEFSGPISQLIARAKRRPLLQAEFLRLMQMLTQQRMLCSGYALQHYEEIEPRLKRARPDDATLKGLFTPKLAELRELIAQLAVEQGLKMVVFSQWRRMLALAEWATADILAGAKLRSVYFTGAESQKRRTQNIIDFHDDPAARVLFASDAGGVGLNLQRAASVCINLELPWNPAVLEQRIGRVYRLGQNLPVQVYNLVAESGIESRIASLVADKQALFTGLFDSASDEVKFEGAGSFLSRVEKLVDAAPAALSIVPNEETEDDADVARDDSPGESVEGRIRAEDPPLTITAKDANEPPPPASVESSPVATVDAFRGLLAGVRVEMRPDGGVSIDAPRDAAAALATLFGEMARRLSDLAQPMMLPGDDAVGTAPVSRA